MSAFQINKNFDAMTSLDDVMTWNHFLKETNCTCLPPESMYARMRGCESMHARMGNLSQCMPECGEGFCKILLALWATWFIFFFGLCRNIMSIFVRNTRITYLNNREPRPMVPRALAWYTQFGNDMFLCQEACLLMYYLTFNTLKK
jgi:hypothetical protein